MRPALIAALAALPTAAACGKPRAAGPPPPPVAADPHLIEMAAETTTDLVPAESPAELAIRIRVSAARPPSASRPPLDLVLALDTSGSMEGPAIEALRGSAHDLIERMSPRDHLAVVTFASTAQVLVPSTELTAEARDKALEAVAHIEARGTTDMASGLDLALGQIAAGKVNGSVDRVVLLGDGVPNDPSPLPSLVDRARAGRISITTLGLGLESDENVLGDIAMKTGGVYRYVDKPEAVADVFDHELTRMQTVVGRNLYLQLQPGPGVTIEDMPGMSESGPKRVAMLGDLAAGESRDVIVPIKITGHRDGATVELVDALLTFDDAAGGSGPQRRDAFASAKASADADAVAKAVKVEIDTARARARAASAILQAIAEARGGQLDQARALLKTAEAEARAVADKTDDAELRELADQMVAVSARLEDLVQLQQAQPAAEAPAPAPAEVEEVLHRAHEKATRALDRR